MQIIPVHTGMPWFDLVVYIASGSASLALCYLVPRWIHDRLLVARDLLRSLRRFLRRG